MITDSFFVQGHTHEVCEDYALDGKSYVIVSDGCSNAGGPRIHTDFGSRLLCKAAEENIKELNIHRMLKAVAATAQTQQRLFPNLPVDCLTATLMTLRQTSEGKEAIVVGDGIVGGITHEGMWKIHIIEYVSGGLREAKAPFYLKYVMFNEVDKYLELFGGKFKITTYQGNLNSPLFVAEDLSNRKSRSDLYQRNMEVEETTGVISEENLFTRFVFGDEFKLTFVCSDGIEAVYQPSKNKGNQFIFSLDTIRIILDFVQFNPGFARAQSNWVFKRNHPGTFLRRGWFTGDDISVGIIYDPKDPNGR